MERPKGLIGKAIGRTNWNTDFLVDQPYRSFKLFFTADSSDPSSYPVQAFLKFSDGSNRKVDYRVAKSVNDGIGANNDPAATGFSYRISVQGCH